MEPLNLSDYTRQFNWTTGPQCLFCGKKLNPKTQKMIGLDPSNGYILPANAPSDSWFEIGPECARKLPNGYIRVEAANAQEAA